MIAHFWKNNKSNCFSFHLPYKNLWIHMKKWWYLTKNCDNCLRNPLQIHPSNINQLLIFSSFLSLGFINPIFIVHSKQEKKVELNFSNLPLGKTFNHAFFSLQTSEKRLPQTEQIVKLFVSISLIITSICIRNSVSEINYYSPKNIWFL